MYTVYTGQLHVVIVLISFLHATFMKIGENDSAHELCENAAGNFKIDDLHLQIIESISPKASVENSSAQWAIFIE